MKPISKPMGFDHETQEIRWVSTKEVFELISLTITDKGRLRDTNALIHAIKTRETTDHPEKQSFSQRPIGFNKSVMNF